VLFRDVGDTRAGSETGSGPQARPRRRRAGLVIAVIVLAANTHDNAADVALLDQVAEHTGGTVEKALVDQGFENQVVAHGAGLGIDVETVEPNPQERGFVPQPKRCPQPKRWR
jgi:hypothetical protein